MIGKSLVLVLALAGQAPSAGEDVPDREQPAWMEIGPTRISARLRSNGCTRKEDFRVSTLRGGNSTLLVFSREKPDPCRAFLRDGVVLTWTRAELGLRPDESIAVSWTGH